MTTPETLAPKIAEMIKDFQEETGAFLHWQLIGSSFPFHSSATKALCEYIAKCLEKQEVK